jgi:hypothetical protein
MRLTWTPEQDAILRKYYHSNETKFLKPLLPTKTLIQIGKRAYDLGLVKSKAIISEQHRRNSTKNRICKIDGCGKKHASHGFCHNHDMLFLRGSQVIH